MEEVVEPSTAPTYANRFRFFWEAPQVAIISFGFQRQPTPAAPVEAEMPVAQLAIPRDMAVQLFMGLKDYLARTDPNGQPPGQDPNDRLR